MSGDEDTLVEMNLRDSSLSETELQRQREVIRRSLLRANTAVAVVLLAVLALAAAAVVFSRRAAHGENRAMKAEAESRERLRAAYLAQARALRAGTQMGRRAEALAAVSNAVALAPSLELRDEAIACLTQADLEVEFTRPLPEGTANHTFDRELESYFTSGKEDGVFVIRRLADGAVLRTLYGTNASADARGELSGAAFSRGGRFLGTQFRNGATVVWEVRTGRPVFQLPASRSGFNGGSISFSDDAAARMVFIDGAFPQQIAVADLQTGRHRMIPAPVGPRGIFRISPEGARVAVVSGLEVLIRDLETGETIQTLKQESESRSMAWDPSGKRLAVGCYNGDVWVWELAGARARVLAGPTTLPWWLEFNADGSRLATVALDGVSRVWDVQGTRLRFSSASGQAVYFSADGTRLGFEVPGKAIGVWRLAAGTGFRSVRGKLGNGAMMWGQNLSADGRWLGWSPASWSPPLGLELISVDNGRTAGTLSLATGPAFTSVLFHPAEAKVMTVRAGLAEWRALIEVNQAHEVKLEFGLPEPIALPAGFRIWCGALGGHGQILAAQGEDGRLLALDLAQPGKFVELEGRSTSKSAPGPGSATGSGRIAVSEDGRWIAVGGGLPESGVHVWDAQTGRRAARLAGAEATLAFSPDGRWLASASSSAVELWSIGKWTRQWTKLRSAPATGFGAVAFSGDGSYLAALGDQGRMQLLEIATGDELATIVSPQNLAHTGLRLSRDGGMLVAPGANSTVEIWDLRAIRRQLAALGLDWGRPLPVVAGPLTARPALPAPVAALVFGFVVVGAASVMVLFALRRHRRLVQDFVKAESDAMQRRRELEVAKVELLHSQKMKALGTLAAGIAHDFNNLLSVIRMSNKLISRATKGNADVSEEIAHIEEAVQHGKQVVGSMLGYSRERADEDGACDLDEMVEETVSLLSKEFLSGIELTLALDRHAPPVNVRRGRLEQILLNLLVNASEAMKGRGKLKIAVQAVRSEANGAFVLRPREGGKLVELNVADSGPGIAPEILPRIFEPFFTTKTTGGKQGTGLGLSMVYTIAEQDGLGLIVESAPGCGATFRVLLPCAPDAQFPKDASNGKRKA